MGHNLSADFLVISLLQSICPFGNVITCTTGADTVLLTHALGLHSAQTVDVSFMCYGFV